MQTARPTPVEDEAVLPDLGTDVGAASSRPLNVCILTADIAGPVRSGGIGTAFAQLADLLAADGHMVTIAFVHPKPPDDRWFEHYRSANMRFVHVPARRGAIDQALCAYHWLKAQAAFDLVHVSEWHGLGAFAQQARRLGLAFEQTHFAVKASSPTLWNEEGNGQALSSESQIEFAALERLSAELADTLISGSQHMLRWMSSRQYALDGRRCFVQPNVFAARQPEASGRAFQPKELVFFGRLEPRKGVLLFCEAVDQLVREGREVPAITFLGGTANRFEALPYISGRAATWPCVVSARTDLGFSDALDYLRGGDRLAVIPSLLENSSMAVMECLAFRIPFIACATGGTPELIDQADRGRALCAPDPAALAQHLKAALSGGVNAVRPAHDFSRSNRVWRAWHMHLPGAVGPEDRPDKVEREAVLLTGRNVRLKDNGLDILKRAYTSSGAEIVTSFYRRSSPFGAREVACTGDLIAGELSNDGIAGPCCLVSGRVMKTLAIDPVRPHFPGLYRAALLAGFRVDVVPDFLFTVRSWF